MTLYSEYVVGYRMWQVIDNQLHSLTFTRWPARQACVASAIPKLRTNTDGIHAFKNRPKYQRRVNTEAARMSGGLPWLTGHSTMAVGRVALWGQIAVHEDGYRAQYAYPLELAVLDSDPALIEHLHAVYGVPVVAYEYSSIWRDYVARLLPDVVALFLALLFLAVFSSLFSVWMLPFWLSFTKG